jgi:L-ascorbate metabolism protein UlaG (beta-lactamase superfamily)
MTNLYRKIVFIITLICISNFGYSQSNEIEIKFIGNCGLYLTDGNSDLYIDFLYKSGAYGYMKYDQAEIDSIKENAKFLFTHRHANHYSKKILKKIKSKHKGTVFGSWNNKKFEKLSTSIDDFKIEIFKTKHRLTISGLQATDKVSLLNEIG